jgi:hypothetical protein
MTDYSVSPIRFIRSELMNVDEAPLFYILDSLETGLPCAKRVELPGADHSATWNADRGGRPAMVADEMPRFVA